ncbi:MAG: hypothetical protein L6406_14375 [Desulfobacterales bacterium]|nr:hypothetical protein [Desulfobacterales bacterium]
METKKKAPQTIEAFLIIRVCNEMNYENPEEVFSEMTSLTPKSYAGMTYERLGLDGLGPARTLTTRERPICTRIILPGVRVNSTSSNIRIRRKCPARNTHTFLPPAGCLPISMPAR